MDVRWCSYLRLLGARIGLQAWATTPDWPNCFMPQGCLTLFRCFFLLASDTELFKGRHKALAVVLNIWKKHEGSIYSHCQVDRLNDSLKQFSKSLKDPEWEQTDCQLLAHLLNTRSVLLNLCVQDITGHYISWKFIKRQEKTKQQ